MVFVCVGFHVFSEIEANDCFTDTNLFVRIYKFDVFSKQLILKSSFSVIKNNRLLKMCWYSSLLYSR